MLVTKFAPFLTAPGLLRHGSSASRSAGTTTRMAQVWSDASNGMSRTTSAGSAPRTPYSTRSDRWNAVVSSSPSQPGLPRNADLVVAQDLVPLEDHLAEVRANVEELTRQHHHAINQLHHATKAPEAATSRIVDAMFGYVPHPADLDALQVAWQTERDRLASIQTGLLGLKVAELAGQLAEASQDLKLVSTLVYRASQERSRP